jgi:HEAT repeat protein
MMFRLLLLLVVGVLPAWGQAVSAEDRTAVLQYGIETEVLDLVRELRQERNIAYRLPMLEAYDHARTDELKEALLLFFLDLKDNGLEDRAVLEIASPEKKGNSLLLNAISYLTEIKSLKVKETLVGLISGKNKVLALSAIRALGKLVALDKVDDLLKLYNDAETDPNFKPDLIWSFGEMKAVTAVPLLLTEYDENESQPLLRRSILEALGKIGDPSAWGRVEAALADTNTDLRAAAVGTISSYPGQGDQVALLTSALRDAQPAVREAEAQAVKTLPRTELKGVLSYRVKKDPEAKVRIAAIQALAAYDDGSSTVLSVLADSKSDPAIWRESLNLALDKKYPGTYDALKTVLEADAKDKTGDLTAVIGQALLAQRETYRTLYGLMLASDKAPARSTALRAVQVGKFTEYESVLKTMSTKDLDAGVKAQAAAILKEWATPPAAVAVPAKK